MYIGTQEWPVQPKRMPEGGTNLLSNKKISNPSGWLPENAFFWKGGTCSYFLSFCQQLNSCVPNGLKLSQNIVWQPWKQNLTIIDFQRIHSMSTNIPQSGEIRETRGVVNIDLYFLNTVIRTWPLKNWKEFILLIVLNFLKMKYLWYK